MDVAVRELVKATAANGGVLPPEFERSDVERAVVLEAERMELICPTHRHATDSAPSLLTEKGWDLGRKCLAEAPQALRAHLSSRARRV
jgi:hypothetical protein